MPESTPLESLRNFFARSLVMLIVIWAVKAMLFGAVSEEQVIPIVGHWTLTLPFVLPGVLGIIWFAILANSILFEETRSSQLLDDGQDSSLVVTLGVWIVLWLLFGVLSLGGTMVAGWLLLLILIGGIAVGHSSVFQEFPIGVGMAMMVASIAGSWSGLQTGFIFGALFLLGFIVAKLPERIQSTTENLSHALHFTP